jgi:hypothetical protein
MKRISILLAGIFLALFPFVQWSQCARFTDRFHFSPFDLQLRLIESIHNDSGVPLVLVRFFHNKLIGTLLDIFAIYTRYWELSFLVNIVSFLGIFGFFAGIYYFQRKYSGNRILWFLLVVIFFMPFIEVLAHPKFGLSMKLFLYYLPLNILVLFGIWHYVSCKQYWVLRLLSLVILIVISLWWNMVMNPVAMKYCVN